MINYILNTTNAIDIVHENTCCPFFRQWVYMSNFCNRRYLIFLTIKRKLIINPLHTKPEYSSYTSGSLNSLLPTKSTTSHCVYQFKHERAKFGCSEISHFGYSLISSLLNFSNNRDIKSFPYSNENKIRTIAAD